MMEDTETLKKKMLICAVLQGKFRCRCIPNDRIPFCDTVVEVYKECVTIR